MDGAKDPGRRPLRLVVVDDHEMVLEGLKALFARFPVRVRMVGQALEAATARTLTMTLNPDVVVSDVRLRDSASGLDLCRQLVEAQRYTKVVLLNMEIALYRIAQEALQNVVKHAHATTARLRFRCAADQVVLEVTADGRGFDQAAAVPVDELGEGGYGISGMTERAELIGGHLAVDSKPGRGTTVSVRVPLTPLGETARGDHQQP